MHSTGLLLLSAVAGYWVLERSLNHKGSMRRAGQILGAVVILLGIAGAVCQAITLAMGGGQSYPPLSGHWGKKAGYLCPITGMGSEHPASQ